MTTTLLQQQHATQTSSNNITTTVTAQSSENITEMAWSSDKISFSCIDNIGLKHLWKLIALNSKHNSKIDILDKKQQQQQTQTQQQCNNNNEQISLENFEYENLADYLTTNRLNILPPSRMSLLKFLAINALDLSAPATPVLLQQQQEQQQQSACTPRQPAGWMQLSGHPESIVPTTAGIVRKRIGSTSDHEVLAYQLISQEPQTAAIVPHYYGTLQLNNGENTPHNFIELQDLLAGFKDPCVMDIKMGTRTFLETEVSNHTLRPDLYKKMIAVDPQAPTAEEHQLQAITKLRYMLFRETMSSSHSKGFRIEALRKRGAPPIKDLKTCRSGEQIKRTIEEFCGARRATQKQLIARLKQMRAVMEQSKFFQTHEIVGSSIFIVYDDDRVGAWLIDFAKSRQLPAQLQVTHRREWLPGNREEGLLHGMDELIAAFENVLAQHSCGTRKCLQI